MSLVKAQHTNKTQLQIHFKYT